MTIMTLLFSFLLLLLAMLAVVCGFLYADRRALRADRDRLVPDLDRANRLIETMRQQIGDAQQKLAVAEQVHDNLKQELAKAHEQLRDAFRGLAGEVLKESKEDFLQLARKTFESGQKDAVAQLEQRKQAIESLIKPVRETLDKYNTSIQQIESGRKEAYGSLKQQLAALMEDQRRLRGETSNLVQALRRPEVRGRWGEMQLRRVAELAGMIENCDFTEQKLLRTEDGSLRPDMVVHLPNQCTIVVDAKTPLDAYISSVTCQDDARREELLKRHTGQIEDKVRALSAKQYAAQFADSPDFVVLFIPGESFLQAAVQLRPSLWEDAWQKGVLIATPSTLIALLKAVSVGWREQRLAENARRISDLGRELHDRIATMVSHVEKLGSSLGGAVKSYNDFVGSLESRVLVTARRFSELGAGSSKALPAEDGIKRIDTAIREVKRPSEVQPAAQTPDLDPS